MFDLMELRHYMGRLDKILQTFLDPEAKNNKRGGCSVPRECTGCNFHSETLFNDLLETKTRLNKMFDKLYVHKQPPTVLGVCDTGSPFY
jgi:hypothetical protein